MSYGITSTGFVIKDFTTIKSELILEAEALWGSNFDKRETNPTMIYINLMAAREQALWNILNDMYGNQFIITGVGTALDFAGIDRGLTRLGATKSVGTVKTSGDPAVEIPFGTVYSTSGDNPVNFLSTQTIQIGLTTENFVTTGSTQLLDYKATGSFGTGQVTVTVGGTLYTEVASSPGANQFACDYADPSEIEFDSGKSNVTVVYYNDAATSEDVPVEAERVGTTYNVGINQINTLGSSISGITSVTNEAATINGTNVETDPDFRARLIAAPVARWTEADLESLIKNITGVRGATVDDGERIEELTSTGQTAQSTWWKNDLAIETGDIFRVTFYDYSVDTRYDLESTITTVDAGEYWLDDSSGPTTVIQYRGPNGDGSLSTNDTLTVTYMDDDIGVGIFRAIIIPVTPPLSVTLRDTIEASIKSNKAIGVSYFVDEPIFSKIDLEVTLVLDSGFVVSDVDTEIQDSLTAHMDTLEVGGTLYHNKLIDIIMAVEGITDITKIAYDTNQEEVTKGIPNDEDVTLYPIISLPATIDDEYGTSYATTTDYELGTGDGVEWDVDNPDPGVDIGGFVIVHPTETDKTTEATNATTDDMELTRPSGTIIVGDYVLFGASVVWNMLALHVSTAGDGVWGITWEYKDASSWTALTDYDLQDGTNEFKPSSTGVKYVTFNPPSDWTQTTIQSKNLYWIRARVTTQDAAPVTRPLGQEAWTAKEPGQNQKYYVDYGLSDDTNVVAGETTVIIPGDVTVI